MNIALLILRLVLGLAMAAHGTQKLFAWFGGAGIPGVGAFMESIGFRPGKLFATFAGLGEFLGGLLLALGFLGPIRPALMITVMLVATLTFHRGHGFFNVTGGPELPILYITGALVVALAGPGPCPPIPPSEIHLLLDNTSAVSASNCLASMIRKTQYA